MRHHNPDTHLTYDELLQAMTDRSDLEPNQQAHLDSCPSCQRQAEDLTYRYHRLGQMARKMAPKPRRAFRVPDRQVSIGRWHFKPGIALGMLGVLIFMFTWWGPQFTENSDTPVPMVALHLENDDRLMEEIDALVDDALPEKYRELAALSDDRSVEDLDEFINWMVPSPDELDYEGEEEDFEQPAASDRGSWQKPLAQMDLSAFAKEGIV